MKAKQKIYKYIVFSVLTVIVVLLQTASLFAQKDEKSEFGQLKQEKFELDYEATFIDAAKQKMLGNTTDALDLYFKALKINPQSAATQFEIARILYSQNDETGAIGFMEKAVAVDKNNVWYLLFLSELYKSRKEYKKAMSITEHLIELDPYNQAYYFEVAALYLYMGKGSKAESTYSRIEKKFGNSENLVEDRYKFYLISNRLPQACEQLERIIAQYPNENRYYRMLADTYLQAGNQAKALETYNRLLKIVTDSSSIRLSLIDIYRQTKDSSALMREVGLLFKDTAVDVPTKIKLLIYLDSQKDLAFRNNEERLLKILLDKHPEDAQSHVAYADYLIKHKQKTEAREHLYFAVSHDKSNYYVFEQLLLLENEAQRWDSVFNISAVGIEYFPNQAFLYFFNGYSAYRLDKYHDAINSLSSGITYATTDELRSEFYTYLAEAYLKINNKKLAYSFFEKVLQLNPKNALALNNYSYYLSLDKVNLEKALSMTVECNKLEPQNATYLDTWAWVLFQMKRYSEARSVIEKALSSGGDVSGEVIEHYGDILYRLGENAQAIDQWKRAKHVGGASDAIDSKIKNQSLPE